MQYGVSTVTAASGDVLGTSAVKSHLRVEHDTEDALIAAYVAAAVAHVQSQTGRQLLTATYDVAFDRFPVGSEPQLLPMAPLQSVSSSSTSTLAAQRRQSTRRRSPAVTAW
jgi:uncharacterized phiE125 gp8 family phage protein